VHLIGRHRLSPLNSKGEAVATWLTGWIAELRDAHWKHGTDVTKQFPRARLGNDGFFLFPVAQLPVSIQMAIFFQREIALIKQVTRGETDNGR